MSKSDDFLSKFNLQALLNHEKTTLGTSAIRMAMENTASKSGDGSKPSIADLFKRKNVDSSVTKSNDFGHTQESIELDEEEDGVTDIDELNYVGIELTDEDLDDEDEDDDEDDEDIEIRADELSTSLLSDDGTKEMTETNKEGTSSLKFMTDSDMSLAEFLASKEQKTPFASLRSSLTDRSMKTSTEESQPLSHRNLSEKDWQASLGRLILDMRKSSRQIDEISSSQEATHSMIHEDSANAATAASRLSRTDFNIFGSGSKTDRSKKFNLHLETDRFKELRHSGSPLSRDYASDTEAQSTRESSTMHTRREVFSFDAWPKRSQALVEKTDTETQFEEDFITLNTIPPETDTSEVQCDLISAQLQNFSTELSKLDKYNQRSFKAIEDKLSQYQEIIQSQETMLRQIRGNVHEKEEKLRHQHLRNFFTLRRYLTTYGHLQFMANEATRMIPMDMIRRNEKRKVFCTTMGVFGFVLSACGVVTEIVQGGNLEGLISALTPR
eukprot:CAMPEP_0114991334 /NCGR_PEP_ID=MMETSP0216-20121206/11305_1 /TAXON_ID=223996 /ORGANISM="Protocruzia adherens, Strain Boccale" /LENGTH=497 /DNA_ID=CAMNT_0002354631 /DNA_START=28 /DNA_END=1521 /DNA_ORIENTATION=-